MNVIAQLKHLLVIISKNKVNNELRFKRLFVFTPISAENISFSALDLLHSAEKLGIVTKHYVYKINLALETNYLDVFTAKELNEIKKIILSNYKLLDELSNLCRPSGEFKFNYSDLVQVILLQLNLIRVFDNKYYFTSDMQERISLERPWKFKENKFQEEIGKFAEKVIFNLEREKLSSKPEILCTLKHVSLENDSLGFDIVSYDIKLGRKMYLEVKGTTFEEPEFFITTNELSTAKKFKENYKVLVVCGINLEKQTYKNITEINNPSVNLYEKFKVEPQLFKISKK